MPYNPKLVSYVSAGLSKGFREDHIATILRKHGHSEADIREAFSHTTPPTKPTNKLAIGVATFTVLLIVGLLAIGQFSNTPTTAAVTGNVIGVQATADELALLQDKVDKQQIALDSALEQSKKNELSTQEKDKLLAQLQDYYGAVKQERETTKTSLFDLWTFLFSKK